MLLTFQDRLRVPWRGGAKQVSLEAIVPILLLPLTMCVAAINMYCSIIVCMALPLFLGYAYYYLKKNSPRFVSSHIYCIPYFIVFHCRSKFFFLWALWSVVYLWIMFESTVPLMELLPEENIVFTILIALTVFCFYKVLISK